MPRVGAVVIVIATLLLPSPPKLSLAVTLTVVAGASWTIINPSTVANGKSSTD